MRRLACLLAFCMVAVPLRVAASPPGSGDRSETPAAIVVWSPQLAGVAGEQAAGSIRAAFRAGLARAELAVVDAPAAAESCRDPACRATAARTVGAGHAIELEVRGVDRDFDVRARLIDVATGEVRELAEGCSICGLEDACALVESLGARLGPVWQIAVEEGAARRMQEQALREQPRLRVVTTPAGATVLVDGQRAGVTPLVFPVTAGRHVVELRRSNYLGETREVHLTRGIVGDLTVSLRADDACLLYTSPSPRD